MLKGIPNLSVVPEYSESDHSKGDVVLWRNLRSICTNDKRKGFSTMGITFFDSGVRLIV